MIMDKYTSAYPLNTPPLHSPRSFPDFGSEMEAKLAIKTLFFVGPSSTGKSTLFHAVAKEMNLDPGQCITEAARTVMRNTGFSRNTVGCVNPSFHPF